MQYGLVSNDTVGFAAAFVTPRFDEHVGHYKLHIFMTKTYGFKLNPTNRKYER